MDSIFLRCFVDHDIIQSQSSPKSSPKYNNSTNLVFDTEVIPNPRQSLLLGSCGVWVYGRLEKFYLFYGDDISNDKIKAIQEYGSGHGCMVLSRKDFVESVFYPYVFQARAKCIGFNLPFDLSRLAIKVSQSRRYKNGFSLVLSKNRALPRIVIKSLNSKASFIEFTKPIRKKSEKKTPHYKGCFIDLKTLAFSLTNESYSLKSALEDFECSLKKIETDVHGKITPEYIKYNINDTKATYELYTKAIERYRLYLLDKQENQLFSPASIGKAYLEKIGVRTFSEKNPKFPKNILGYTMASYYGARTDVLIRRKPAKVTYIDFTSMYPTIFVLFDLYRFLIADTISYKNTTRQTQDFLDRVRLEDIHEKKFWKGLVTICRIRPDGDILPVRANYGEKHTTNIGVNYLKSADGTILWYTLPDIISSKLLSGKTPIIEEAITFFPDGVQNGLKEIEIIHGISVKPEEDFIRKLIEERLRIKQKPKTVDKEKTKQDDLNQNILKIIANATSYGIFIQIDTEHDKKGKATVHGLDSFDTMTDKLEKQGRYFHPIMSVFLTAGSRLILSATETLVKQNNGYVAYCDTDSVFVSPDHAKIIQDFFRPLNPYNQDVEMFKIEEYEDPQKNKCPLDNVWYYGISAKRYVLYDYKKETDEVTIFKHSAHGLGHLDDIDEIQWWKDILAIHYDPTSKDEILSKYEKRYAMAQLTINNWDTLTRFDTINSGKSYKSMIKPFNFSTVGIGYRVDQVSKKPIIPFLPLVGKNQKNQVQYMPFVDYKTGVSYPNKDSLDTKYYWKPLSEVMEDYYDNRESKSDGDIGLLTRKHLLIDKSSISYIGKESNELEESEIVGVDDENYTKYDDIQSKIVDIIKNLKLEDLSKLGISRRAFFDWKKKIKNNIQFTIKKRTLKKLLKL